MTKDSKVQIGILASGSGTTFEAVRQADLDGTLQASVAFVVCNNPPEKAGVWQRAETFGLGGHTYLVNNRNFPDKQTPLAGVQSQAASTEILRLARDVYGVTLLVSLGYMKRVVTPLLGVIPIANLHPGPLPETAGTIGEGAPKRAIELNLKNAGPTFYFMDTTIGQKGLPVYDVGEIIAHQPVPIDAEHRKEYKEKSTASLLFADIQKIEKIRIVMWIDKAVQSLK